MKIDFQLSPDELIHTPGYAYFDMSREYIHQVRVTNITHIQNKFLVSFFFLFFARRLVVVVLIL